VLLSDPATAKFISREFVASWECVRPVPKVTIDFGNGKILKRTLQGNTVIYLCLSDGRVIDALPGIYTPQAFKLEAAKALALIHPLEQPAADVDINSAAAAWHKQQVSDAILSEKRRITFSKALVESPLLKALGIAPRPVTPTPVTSPTAAGNSNASVVPAMDLASAFASVSARLEDMSHFASTAAQTRKQVFPTNQPGNLSPEELGKMAVELDTTNNLRMVRPAVHMLLAQSARLPLPNEVRDTIYKKILQVPIDEPTLGLSEIAVPGTP
jgi:hypothetical protein